MIAFLKNKRKIWNKKFLISSIRWRSYKDYIFKIKKRSFFLQSKNMQKMCKQTCLDTSWSINKVPSTLLSWKYNFALYTFFLFFNILELRSFEILISNQQGFKAIKMTADYKILIISVARGLVEMVNAWL